MRIKHFIIILTVTLLASCATASKDISLQSKTNASTEEATNTGFIVYATHLAGQSGTISFSPVDTDKEAISKEEVNFVYGGWGIGDRLTPDKEQSDKSLLLLIKPTRHGEFALTEGSWNYWNGVGTTVVSLCMFEGATVFNIEPGKVNVISSADTLPPNTQGRLSSAYTDEKILQEVALARADYDGVVGEAVIVKPTKVISWERGKTGLLKTEKCSAVVPDSVSVQSIDY